MKYTVLILLIGFLSVQPIQNWGSVYGQDKGNVKSFILLGDIHFDLWQDHDSSWLAKSPDDYRQVAKEYTKFTKESYSLLINEILLQSEKPDFNVKGIIQTGDLQEGLAGRPELALQMTQHALDGLRANDFIPPWLLTKGNHDITGPGANESYQQVIYPFLQNELNKNINSGSYSYTIDDIKIISLDCYDKENIIPFLERELNSNEKFKIITTHQPVIPVTGRLWHIFESPQDSLKRIHLLNLIAKNKAVVVCGHLHKYSVVQRMTEFGPVIQIMMNSVIRNKNKNVPYSYTTTYGTVLVEDEPAFSSTTKELRLNYLGKEFEFIKNFRLADMPGYGILQLNSNSSRMILKVYAGLGEKLYETVLIENEFVK